MDRTEIARVFRQYTTLPPRAQWDSLDLDPYLDELPDALCGIVRQFAANALDYGRMAIRDPHAHKAYRSSIFELRERFLQQMLAWLEFYGLIDEDGRLVAEVKDALLEEYADA